MDAFPVLRGEAAETELQAVANAIILYSASNRVPMASVAQKLPIRLFLWMDARGRFTSIVTSVMCHSGGVSKQDVHSN